MIENQFTAAKIAQVVRDDSNRATRQRKLKLAERDKAQQIEAEIEPLALAA